MSDLFKNQVGLSMMLLVFSELQKVRQQVVKEIKSNQQLEHDLDQMDIKIGLLIKNRITLSVSTLLIMKTPQIFVENA